ncbi:MAG: histidine--tRNA ligase [Thermodesulfovibrionales bacterium]|nr:histidine--tRNA ligase [Thermodesulfovibrionales bacterium]
MKYNAPKGIHDILPPDIYLWQKIEKISKNLFEKYGYQEIRTPIIEHTDIFIRSIGEETDIVEKEMYTFLDRAGRSLTLRPEGTASVVRSFVEHNLNTLPTPQKFYYVGPMFRYERPQKGRFRQFYQIGVEAFGEKGPLIDAEVIAMLVNFLNLIGCENVNIELNSIGCETCRPLFKKELINFFSNKLSNLCTDCQRRHKTNPLRILDCKVDGCIENRQGAPMISRYLCENCTVHFEELKNLLNNLNIPYTLNPELVRGLDYYTKTTFEATSNQLGAQKAVAAGGRYDKLVEEFGGPPTSAIGFAIGLERIITLTKEKLTIQYPDPLFFIATIGKEAEMKGLILAENLRQKGYYVEIHYGNASLKSQLRKADRINAKVVLIIGDEELKSGKIKWKNLYTKEQGDVDINAVVSIVS